MNLVKLFLLKKTDNGIIQFIRYTFVGGVAFLVDFGTLSALTLFPFFCFHYILSSALSFILGLLLNYSLSIRWVFNKRTFENWKFEFTVFSSIGLIGLAFNSLFIWFFTDTFFLVVVKIENMQIRILSAKIISTVFVYIWNFFARKMILFTQKEN